MECWFRVPPTDFSDRRADRQSVKWRTAVGGGSPLGPEGAATPVPGGEQAE